MTRSFGTLYLLVLTWSLAACAPQTASCAAGLMLTSEGRCVPSTGDANLPDTGIAPDASSPDTDGCVRSTFYVDADHDGYGAATGSIQACAMPTGFVAMGGDCDDACASCHPGGTEICGGGLDEDCDMQIDEMSSTTWYRDADGDGHGDSTMTMTACAMPTGYVMTGDDCDDTSTVRFPTNAEICDGIDNDCNTQVDDTLGCVLGASVSCTTSCGSTGMGACSATCTLPTGAACIAPAETCDDVDQDCDGIVDEGRRVLGTQRDIGAGTTGIEALATPTGFVTVYSSPAIGIRAQRLDATGMLAGAQTTLGSGTVFGATVIGTSLVIASMSGNNIVAAVYGTADLSNVTPSTTITALAGATELRVVANGSSVTFVASDGITLGHTSRSLPGLTGSGALTTIDGSMRGDFDVAQSGAHAYVTYVDTTYNVETRGLTIGGAIDASITGTLVSGGAPMRRPTIAVGSVGGTTRLGIAWEHDGGTSAAQNFYFASYDISGTGTLTAHTATGSIYSGLAAITPSASTESRALDLIYANGAWVVSIFSGGSTSTWSVIELEESGGLVASTPMAIEVPASDNRDAAMAYGGGAHVLFAATRSDSTNARTHLWGCGP